MKLGLSIGDTGPEARVPIDLIQHAERAGFDSVWAGETWGEDAVTVLTWAAAHTQRIKLGTNIVQMQARSPALVANTMSALDFMSGQRGVMVGIGLSGPQVIEGWHGVRFGSPYYRTREYIEIMRKVWAREAPVEYQGREYQLPYKAEDSTGLGKPLRTILHPRQLPVYVGAIGPKNIRTTAELADGWLITRFSPKQMHLYRPHLEEGFRRAGNGKSFKDFEIVTTSRVIFTDDVKAGLDSLKPFIALYVGGMGARTMNFHNQQARAYGYAEAAERIQELYLSGRRAEAIEAVPDELADEISLVGPRERIRQKLVEWEDAGATMINVGASHATPREIDVLAELTGANRGANVAAPA